MIAVHLYLEHVKNRRQAILEAREQANALIEQSMRIEKGYDNGSYRDDDPYLYRTIRERRMIASAIAFELSRRFK